MVGTYLCVETLPLYDKRCAKESQRKRPTLRSGLFPLNDPIFIAVYGTLRMDIRPAIHRTIFCDNYCSSSTSVQHAFPRFASLYKSFVFACFTRDYKFVLVIVTREQFSRIRRLFAVNVNDFSSRPTRRLLFHRDRNGRNATRDKLPRR